jgi:hypothetical protein
MIALAALLVVSASATAAAVIPGGHHHSQRSVVAEIAARASNRASANLSSSTSAQQSAAAAANARAANGSGGSARSGGSGGSAGTGSGASTGSSAGASSAAAVPGAAGAPGAVAKSSGAASAPGQPTPAAQPGQPVQSTLQATTPLSVNITANIAAVPASDASCASAPTGAACTNAAIAALNHARAVLGLPAYAIPANFASMSVATQLLTLSNLDRVLYGLQPISGLNATVNTAAQQGVTSGGDPIGVNVGAAQWTSWASNWASGYPNATFTYYAWMYDDGLGSPNGDCTAANSSGCWGHRLNTLHNFGSGTQIAMGVGSSGVTFTELYESFSASAAIPY